ncbi:hypothetical protein EVAR_21810_1 [Eumeta japonica]|uniref:Transposase n=1 Tax=Eumeta variegata TaxID=151549 RepID=A0A4C1YL32_EUMVA|nr:hypothetical protein EVAR_21810_1 [Eumeta japonica]
MMSNEVMHQWATFQRRVERSRRANKAVLGADKGYDGGPLTETSRPEYGSMFLQLWNGRRDRRNPAPVCIAVRHWSSGWTSDSPL